MQNDTPQQDPMTPPTPPVTPPIEPTPPNPFGSPVNPMADNTQPPVNGFGSQPAGMGAPMPTPQNKKSKTPLIILVIVIALLIIGGVVAAIVLNGSGTSSTENNTTSASEASEKPASEKEAVVASTANDFSAVCDGKKISNAVPMSSPVKIAPFIQTSGQWGPYIYSFQDDGHATSKLTEINAVACAYPDESTLTEAKTCQAKNSSTDAPLTLQYKGITYDLVFYNAQTGEKLSEGKVTAANTTCPLYALSSEYIATPLPEESAPVFDAFFKANP